MQIDNNRPQIELFGSITPNWEYCSIIGDGWVRLNISSRQAKNRLKCLDKVLFGIITLILFYHVMHVR